MIDKLITKKKTKTLKPAIHRLLRRPAIYVSVLFQAPRSPSFLSRILLSMRKQLTDRQRMNYVFITRVWLNRTQRFIFINTLFGRTLSGAGTFLGTILIARHLCLSCSAVKWLNRRRVENSTRLTRNALDCGTVNNTSKHSHVVLLSTSQLDSPQDPLART